MKRRAIAIAIPVQNPFILAAKSARESANSILDFMYGTPKRSRLTVYFALATIVLGYVLDASNSAALQTCPA